VSEPCQPATIEVRRLGERPFLPKTLVEPVVGRPFAELAEAALYDGRQAEEARRFGYVVVVEGLEDVGDWFRPQITRRLTLAPQEDGAQGPLVIALALLGSESPTLTVRRDISVHASDARRAAENRWNPAEPELLEAYARARFAGCDLPSQDLPVIWRAGGGWRYAGAGELPGPGETLTFGPLGRPPAREIARLALDEATASMLSWAARVLSTCHELHLGRRRGVDQAALDLGWRLGDLAAEGEHRARFWAHISRTNQDRSRKSAGGEASGARLAREADIAWRKTVLAFAQGRRSEEPSLSKARLVREIRERLPDLPLPEADRRIEARLLDWERAGLLGRPSAADPS